MTLDRVTVLRDCDNSGIGGEPLGGRISVTHDTKGTDMDLFSRRVLMTGPPADYMAWSIDMCAYVNDKLDEPVSLWSMGLGAPAGTLVYSTRVDGLAGVQANTTKLMADADYMSKVAEAQGMAGAPSEDSLAQPIHGEPGDPPPVGSLATITTAVIANGAYATAIGWGVEMAQLGGEITGMPTMFLMNAFGTFGQVTWISVAADAAAADAAGTAVNSNADYMTKLGDIGDLFVPASGHRSVATRIA